MKPILTLVAALLVVGATAQAGEVYKEKDAKGNPVFTDRPEQLPAERLNVKSQQTDSVEAQRRHDEEMKRYAAAQGTSPAAAKAPADPAAPDDPAKRCQEAKARYQSYMNAQRLYEPGAKEGDRQGLADRADAPFEAAVEAPWAAFAHPG